jgi:Na+-transporting NADH:ubiquinone oxidoreductase subunit NqrD
MNVKNIVSSITDGVDSLVAVATSLIVLSVFTAILFGGSVFGVSVVENIMALIQAFLDGGFTGLLALLVLLSFWK